MKERSCRQKLEIASWCRALQKEKQLTNHIPTVKLQKLKLWTESYCSISIVLADNEIYHFLLNYEESLNLLPTESSKIYNRMPNHFGLPISGSLHLSINKVLTTL